MTQTAGRTAWYVERFQLDEFCAFTQRFFFCTAAYAARKEALDAFVELGFPTARDEEWRYHELGPACCAGSLALWRSSVKKSCRT